MDSASIDAKLGELPLLAALKPETRALVAPIIRQSSDVLRYRDNDTVIEEGYLSFGTGYVLLDGKVTVDVKPEPITLSAPAVLGEMAQFRAFDLRTANVRANGEVTALQFYWDDIFAAAEEQLPPDALTEFRGSLERQVWERFPHKEIMNLPLFGDLDSDLRMRVCIPFPSISERVGLKRVDALFNQGSRCKMTGFILVGGKIRLLRDRNEHVLDAPNILGIFPGKGEHSKEWTGTAMAEGEAELLKFSWERYTGELTSRFSRQEQGAIVTSFKNNASKHFWH